MNKIILVSIILLFSSLSPKFAKAEEIHHVSWRSQVSMSDQEKDARMIEDLLSKAIFRRSRKAILDFNVDHCLILIHVITNACFGDTSVMEFEEFIDLNEVDRLMTDGDPLPNGSVSIVFIFQDQIEKRLEGVGLDGLLRKRVLDELAVQTRRVLKSCNGEISHMTFSAGPMLFFKRDYYNRVFIDLQKYKKTYCTSGG